MFKIFTDTFLWYSINYKSDLIPPQVYRHQMVLINSNIILFGGINENNQKFNELYNFDFKDKNWTILFPSGEYPASRTYHNMIYCNNKIFVFGGFSNMILNDCYELNLTQKYFGLNEDINKIENNLSNEAYEPNKDFNKDKILFIEKPENTIFLHSDKNDDLNNIEKIIEKALENSENENQNFKEKLLINEYKEEINLLRKQVNELKSKLENEINKNCCKVSNRKIIIILFELVFF